MNGAILPPRPDLGSVAGSDQTGRRRWPLVILGFCIGVGSALWVAGLVLYVGHDHPGGFIDDSAFVQAANESCESALSAFPPPAGADATLDERADAVEGAMLGSRRSSMSSRPFRSMQRLGMRLPGGSRGGDSSWRSALSIRGRSGPATPRCLRADRGSR